MVRVEDGVQAQFYWFKGRRMAWLGYPLDSSNTPIRLMAVWETAVAYTVPEGSSNVVCTSVAGELVRKDTLTGIANALLDK